MLDLDRYIPFSRDEWADLRAATPLTIREKDLEALRGINERIDLDEVAAVYLPLTRLLNLYVSATQNLHKVSATFLGTMARKKHLRPYSPGSPRALARTPQGRPRHDRRVPLPQRGARRARHHESQGVP
jgi:pantothenate kinase